MIDVEKTLRVELTAGMKQRSELPYSKDNAFRMSVKAYNPYTLQWFDLPAAWRSHSQKQEVMTRVCLIAHYAKMPAVLVTSDSRWISSDVFSQHFGLPAIEKDKPGSFEAYRAEFDRILKLHGGEFNNLPREVWQEGVVTWLKGPLCGTHGQVSHYVEGLHDRVQWTDVYRKDRVRHTKLIPDYWEKAWAEQYEIPEELKDMFALLQGWGDRRTGAVS